MIETWVRWLFFAWGLAFAALLFWFAFKGL